MYRDIFEVVDFAPVLPSMWLVQGRAYEEVAVGDTVAAEVATPSKTWELLHFKVIAASFYGVLVPSVNRGHTGGLTIEGPHDQYSRELREVRFLVAPPE